MKKENKKEAFVIGTNETVKKEAGKEYTGELTPEAYEQLKQQNGVIITMVIPADREFKNYSVGYFKKVDRVLMGAYLSMSDEIQKKEMLLNALFLAGDKNILSNDDLFFSACIEVDRLVSFPVGVSVIY